MALPNGAGGYQFGDGNESEINMVTQVNDSASGRQADGAVRVTSAQSSMRNSARPILIPILTDTPTGTGTGTGTDTCTGTLEPSEKLPLSTASTPRRRMAIVPQGRRVSLSRHMQMDETR